MPAAVFTLADRPFGAWSFVAGRIWRDTLSKPLGESLKGLATRPQFLGRQCAAQHHDAGSVEGVDDGGERRVAGESQTMAILKDGGMALEQLATRQHHATVGHRPSPRQARDWSRSRP